jgi:hypothetical protein
MSELQAFSLARCAAILGRHPLTFFGPKSLDFGAFRAAAPGAATATFDDRYFQTLAGYSELLVAPAFYESFADFDFLLIHQLDAFVFEDQLAHWCAKSYDYIGAPWLSADGQWIGVGNGGFSLRRVRAFLEVLASRRRLSADELWSHVRQTTPNLLLRALKYHRKLLASIGLCNDLHWFLRKWMRRREPEDIFWGLHAARFHPGFRVAPPAQALQFAVEAGLEKAWPQLEGRAPFGCHRNWYLEMIQHYLCSDAEPASDRERLVWRLADAAAIVRRGK